MTTGGFVLAFAAWLVVAISAGIAIGRAIRRADEDQHRHP